ncbi:MAG TPA: ATP-binding protein [Candidatus Obscuribacterales bacterium]
MKLKGWASDPETISLTTKAGLAIFATAIVLFYVGTIASQQLQPDGTLLRTQEILFELEGAFGAYADVRSSQVAYVLGGGPGQLNLIKSNRERLVQHLDRLSRLIQKSPVKEEFNDLRLKLSEWLTLTDKTIEARRSQGFDAAWPLLNGKGSQELAEDIEAKFTKIRSSEKQLLFRTNQALGNASLTTIGGIWTLMLLAFLILLSILFLVDRYVTDRQEAERKLAEREARMRAIFDTAPDGIVIVSEDLTIESANSAVQQMFGYEPEDLVGRKVASLMDDFGSEDTEKTGSQSLNAGERKILGQAHETVGRRKDGSSFPVEITLSVLNLGERKIYTGILRDITIRKEAERRVSEFYSTVSHELRTPLTSIRTALGLMTSGAVGEFSEKGAHLVKIAGTECDRLIRLINDILDFRKIEAGKLILKPQLVLPETLIGITFDAMRGLADTADIKLRSDIAAGDEFPCDPDRIVQVLTNLVSNAIKFSDRGSEVIVSVTKDNGKMRFAVHDQGPGIRQDQIHKLFAKFQQLDSSDTRKQGGTGLGLAISRAIVKQHEGDIGVETKVGQGSTFWFELPAKRGQQFVDEETLQIHRLRVMMLVDDDALSEPLRLLLKRAGLDIIRANSIAQSERVLARGVPDAVLLDVELADGNGLEVLCKQESALIRKEVPIVVINGWEPDSNVIDCPVLLDCQLNPFDLDRLARLCRQAAIKPEGARVFLAEGDVARAAILKSVLERGGYVLVKPDEDSKDEPIIKNCNPDVVVLDLSVSNERCFSLIEEVRREKQKLVPLVIYSEKELTAADVDKLTLGFARHLNITHLEQDDFIHAISILLKGIVFTRPVVVKQRDA